MKYPLFTLIMLFSFSSCDQKECCVYPGIDLQGRFSHKIPDCEDDGNLQTSCTEWLEFVNAEEVDISYGGSAIIYRFDYVREGIDFLQMQGPPTSSFKVSFNIKSSRTLVRTDTQEVWEKTE